MKRANKKYHLLILAVILLTGACGSAAKKKPVPEPKYPAFSIPQIDLNDRQDLQIVISKRPDTYMGHPSSVLLDDGKTMIMMCLDRHGRGNLMWRRSEDGGYTWSEDLPLPEGWDEKLEINGKIHDPFLEIPILYKITDPTGKQRICVYTAGRKNYPARYAVSEDGGQTWSKLKPILFNGRKLTNTVVLFSDMIRLRNGNYLATWHSSGNVFVAETKNGIVFGKPRQAATRKEASLCEGCFIRSPDGKKIALLMRENRRRFNSMICFSKDEGQTWTKPKQMRASLTGDRHQAIYTPDGRLFISFRDRGFVTPSYGDWVAWVGTFADLENFREGQYRVRLKKNFKGTDCGYPTQNLLPDGNIFAATYGGWEKDSPNYIIGFHFKIEQLDALVKK